MEPLRASSVEEAKEELVALSLKNPGLYFTPVACFGLFYESRERLHVNAPSDAPPSLRWYVLNGKVKNFTEAQVIADQLATPAMS